MYLKKGEAKDLERMSGDTSGRINKNVRGVKHTSLYYILK